MLEIILSIYFWLILNERMINVFFNYNLRTNSLDFEKKMFISSLKVSYYSYSQKCYIKAYHRIDMVSWINSNISVALLRTKEEVEL